MDPRTLYEIPLFRMGDSNNWLCVPVIALDDEKIQVLGGRGEPLILKDTELKQDEEGRYVINIEQLDLKFFYPNVDLPKEFEMPGEVLAARAHKRKENAIRKDAIFEQDYKEKRLFFYIQDEILTIKLFGFDDTGKMNTEPERETEAEEIKIIHNRKAIDCKKLKLGHPAFPLPEEVLKVWEPILLKKKLRSLALVPAGISMLDGLQYFKLNMEIPGQMWGKVETLFQDFGTEGTMQGFLTNEPSTVSEILHIPIE